MGWLARAMIGIAVAATAMAAPSQGRGPQSDTFVGKVRSGDHSAAATLLASNPLLLDAKDSRGDTALLVAVQRRDSTWTVHLLRAGANPDIAARNGETPLISAVRAGFSEGARWLLQAGAKIDATNRMGETALIVAVQNRQLPTVKMLLATGADPDKTDAAAGYSARDYAKRDTRSPGLLAAIEASKRVGTTAPPASDSLDDFKLN